MTLGSGADIDIVTGFPKSDPKAREQVLNKQLEEARRHSAKLQDDLANNGGLVLQSLINVIALHAEKVLMADPIYRIYHDFIEKLGHQINVIPAIMEMHRRKADIPLPPQGYQGKK